MNLTENLNDPNRAQMAHSFPDMREARINALASIISHDMNFVRLAADRIIVID
jgi:ABC-type glutathione transport system ATPase component